MEEMQGHLKKIRGINMEEHWGLHAVRISMCVESYYIKVETWWTSRLLSII